MEDEPPSDAEQHLVALAHGNGRVGARYRGRWPRGRGRGPDMLRERRHQVLAVRQRADRLEGMARQVGEAAAVVDFNPLTRMSVEMAIESAPRQPAKTEDMHAGP